MLADLDKLTRVHLLRRDLNLKVFDMPYVYIYTNDCVLLLLIKSQF